MSPFNSWHLIKQGYRAAYSTARVGVIYVVSLMGIQALANITSTKIKYLFWDEPQAIIYQITGLKL